MASMTPIVMRSKVSSDGLLRVTLPVGIAEANQEVQVTVESIAAKKPMTQGDWHAWVDSMAGSWQGDFERPPQGEYEQREPLS